MHMKRSVHGHRNTDLLGRSAVVLRLKCVAQNIISLNLPKESKILDIGGNDFKAFCGQNNFSYAMIDLEIPQKHGTGGHSGASLTYNGRDLPFEPNSFDVVIVSFVLHHAGSNTIHLLQQIKKISKKYVIICEDLCAIDYPIRWHERCYRHQKNGIFRSDEEWKFLFEKIGLNVIDVLNIRYKRDEEFSDPYDHVYRIQYTLTT